MVVIFESVENVREVDVVVEEESDLLKVSLVTRFDRRVDRRSVAVANVILFILYCIILYFVLMSLYYVFSIVLYEIM